MKRKVNLNPNKASPYDKIENPVERRKAKYNAHMRMVARLQDDPRFDLGCLELVINDLNKKRRLITNLQGAMAGKIGGQFPFETAEFIIDYLLGRNLIELRNMCYTWEK